jgi:cytochrome P450
MEFPAPRGTCPFAPSPDTERLQREQPIARVRIWSGDTPWLITRWQDAREVLSDRRFSADTRSPGYPFATQAFKAMAESTRTLIRQDPPDHSRLRRIVAKELLVKRVEELRPRIQRIADTWSTTSSPRARPLTWSPTTPCPSRPWSSPR